MNVQDPIHTTNAGTCGVRRRRALRLAAPAVIGLLVLVLALNVLTVSAFGDLVVTINGLSHDPANPTLVTAGTVYSFTVVITNVSASANPAEAVEFQYRAPEVVVVHISSSVGWCEVGTPGDPDDPSICSLGNMASGASETITIVVYVPSNLVEGTLLDHDVRAWQFGTEEYPPTNEDHGWMGVTTEADLVITKTDDPETVIAGDLPEALGGVIDGKLLKYTVTVTNTGPSDALNVVVSDTLPVDATGEPQVVFLNSTLTDFVGADQCSADPIRPEKVTCEVGYMTAGQTISFDILVFVYPDVVQAGEAFHNITNTAEVQSTTTDPVPGNNQVTQDTRVEAKADLIITKTDSPDPVVAGEQVVYTISFFNPGPSTAHAVTITDVLPAKFEAIDVDGNPGNGVNPCVPIDPDDEVTCSVSGDVLTGQTVTLTSLLTRGTEQFPGGIADLDPGEGYGFAIVAEVESAYVLDKGVADSEEPLTNPDNPAHNTAYIASETTSGGDWHPDINPDDNQDTELTFVIAQADLRISKTDAPDPTLPDAYLHYDPVTNKFVYTYTLTIENLGSSDAAKVVLYDWVPTDATFRLPPDVIANQIFTPTNDIQCMLRDDGLLLCLVGNDENNTGTNQRGRLNAGSVLSMTFSVEVDPSPTPRTLVNTAWVVAVAEDEFPFALGDTSDDPIEPADFLDGTTPTADQDLTNNTYTETTMVLTGRVDVDKKAYVNRSEARGIDIPTDPIYGNLTEVERCAALAQDNILVLPGDEIVYCYTITNPGETWLRSITLQDAPHGFEWLNPSDYAVIYPDLSVLRGTVTLSGAPAINQTINIRTEHNEKAVLAPAGVADDYLAIIITRKVTVDFPELGPISGVVWQDENGNGVVDLKYSPPPDAVQPEPLQAGVQVDLLDEAGTQVLDSTTTDADGRYVFHDVEPGRYVVRVLGVPSEAFEFDPAKGYSTANFDTLESRWYIESNLWWIDTTFRVLGTNRAGVSALPSTKYSTELPGVPLVFNSDLLYDTLGLPVLEDTTKSWSIYEDVDLDGLPSPLDVIEYVVDIPNTGAIEANGVRFFDWLYNYIADDPDDPRVPALLINGSVEAAIHVTGRDPFTGREIDADLQPPDLAFGEDILLRSQAPGVDLTYRSAIVLDSEILEGNTSGDDEVHVYTRLPIPPKGWLVRFDGVTYDPPIPVTFSLRVKYKVRIKETVKVDTIVLNHGWVYYSAIGLFDQRFPNFDPTDVNRYFDDNREANYHAGTPGRNWETVEFPGWPPIPVGVEPTEYADPPFDHYAMPGAALRDEDDPTWFKVEREAQSIGADSRIQLPVLNRVGGGDSEQTIIEVQNVGREETAVIMFLWADYSAGCAAQGPGPQKAECSGILKPGASWQWQLMHLPDWARSGIAYAVQTDLLPDGFVRPNLNWPEPYPGETIDEYMCAAAQDAIVRNPYDPWDDHPYYAWRSWEEFWELNFQGQPLAIEVDRIGMGVTGAYLSGAYEGFSRAMEGVENLVDGGYTYYSPIVYADFEGLTTWLYIQNSGDRCASVDLWLNELDQCIRPRVCEIELLNPGETYALDVLGECGVGPGFRGSAYLRSAEQLGVIADHVGDEVLLTHRVVPAELDFVWDEPMPWFTAGSQVNYAPLVYREYLGWDSKIFVQNLSSIVNAKVKVYFLDNSGDIITTLVDWVCPRGTQEFFLPLVNNLPGNYVGAVRVESQEWWTPGDPKVPFPLIMSVAQLIKYEGPAKAEVLEGIAYNLFGEDEAFDWQDGEIETWGVRRIALPSLHKENKNLVTDIAIQNVVPKPGFTDFIIYIYDQNGLVGSACEKLNEKQVEYIRLDSWGYIAPAFRGSAVISATYWSHPAVDSTGFPYNLVGLAAVKVERSVSVTGWDIPGDESMGTQGFPVHRPFGFMRADQPLCQPEP